MQIKITAALAFLILCKYSGSQSKRYPSGFQLYASDPLASFLIQAQLNRAPDPPDEVPTQRLHLSEPGITESGIGDNDHLFVRPNGVAKRIEEGRLNPSVLLHS